MHLGMDPFTGNRYAFAGGNPITGIELDGHRLLEEEGGEDVKTWDCGSPVECERFLGRREGPTWDPPDFGGGDFEQHIPYILEMAAKTGVDPQLLLANYIIESHRCTEIAGNSNCRTMQSFQKNMTNPWWCLLSWSIPLAGWLGGQGDEASIGTANFEKKIFEQTRDNTANGARPELEGREWEELLDDPKLNIAAMAYHMQDLQNALPAELKTTFSRNELIRFGYRTGVGNMQDVATGRLPMGEESVENNQMFLKQYARAGR